jgi:polyhydroxyalkanoate synthesis regulator phasin
MLDTVRTLLLAAVGAIDLTEDKARSLVDDLVRRGELAAEEARQIAARLAASRSSRLEAIDGRVLAAIDEALGRRNVASHASVVELNARVAALEAALARSAGQGPPS